MNVARFVVSVIVAFVFITGFEWFVHGNLLADQYAATAHLWRPMDGHMEYFHFMLLSQLGQAFMIGYIFTRHYEAKGLQEGLRFGLYVGLLLAALALAPYAYTPIALGLAIAWMGAALIKGVGVGVVLSLLYKE